MARSAASAVWTVVGVVAAILLGLAVVFGPKLYREGRQLVGPITGLARAEEEMAALDRDLPFTPPADGVIPEERLGVFLKIRRELVPHYQQWESLRRELERTGDSQGWQATKEALAAVSDVLGMQTTLLRRHGMSGTEFRWLERRVYDGWYEQLGASDAEVRLRRATDEDLRFLAEVGARHGRSAALAEVQRHLEARLEALDSSQAAKASGEPNSALLERHREEIAELELSEYQDLHTRMRQEPGEDFSIELGADSDSRRLTIQGQEVEATPTP